MPDYAAALLVRGRIQLAQHNTGEARSARSNEAARLNPLPEYSWTLADALRSLNRIDEAVSRRSENPRRGRRSAHARALSVRPGARTSEEPSSLRNRSSRSEATSSRSTRCAWALARAGQIDEASTFMARALAEGTQDGRPLPPRRGDCRGGRRVPKTQARWARKARTFRFTLLPSELGVLRTGIVASPRA